MNPKKAKEKERRRARKLAEQAWDAAHNDNLDLAEKIIRRAVATQPDNPVLWNDQGMLLNLRNKETEAEDAFRTALSLAPTYAEPYAALAALQAKHGYYRAAVRLMEKAVQYAPDAAKHAERLDAYRLLLPPSAAEEPAVAERPAASSPIGSVDAVAASDLRERVAPLDWANLGQRLTRDGYVVIPALLDGTTCSSLRCLFDDEAIFAKTVVMDRDGFGKGVYRYFKAPIPGIVDELRRAIYPHVAVVANEWQDLLNETERFPESWEEFRLKCQEAGQMTPTPILLKYQAGGFNALHRDLRGSVYFPIQMAVVLSARAEETGGTPIDGFRGGDFLFCDVPEGKKARRREIPAGLGDALLFCTRDRLVRIGGAYGLQPVKHGVSTVTAGTRLVLGAPFHEYR